MNHRNAPKPFDPTRDHVVPEPFEEGRRNTLEVETALQLAKELDAYWHRHGYPHAAHWVETGIIRKDRAAAAFVRSNLVNGVPPTMPTPIPWNAKRLAA